MKIKTLSPPMRYIKAINGTIEAAIVDILFIPPMITRATSKLIMIDVIIYDTFFAQWNTRTMQFATNYLYIHGRLHIRIL